MRTEKRLVALALVAAFAIAGCGDDNNDNKDNDNGGGTSPTPKITATPGPVTPTATVTAVVPTVTSTGETPTPTITPTPATTIACNGEGAALSVTITTQPDSDLDTGWTGISANTEATHDNIVTTNLNCVGDDCQVDGTNLVDQPFGSPLPLSAGGISTCVLNTFREAVTGTYNCDSGCSSGSSNLLSRVFLVSEQAMPCPACQGDATPNDGVKGGTCNGGKTPGAACDVNGISDQFDAAGPEFGHTSNDCVPTGSSVGELNIDLNPLTTDTASVSANVACLGGGSNCYCPKQVQPNACQPNGSACPASGICENGPVDGVCSIQKFRQCRSGSGTEDCEDVFPNSGTCVDEPRPCFGDTITRTGVCGTEAGTLVSIFCIPATRAAAINTTAGLPGPGAVTIPVTQVRTPR